MVDSHIAQDIVQESAQIDDCWNRIGVHGDKSCERLPAHVHCRNCEVYAAAAVRLLERYVSVQDDADLPGESEEVGECLSLLVFRLGDEWLGLATRGLDEVVEVAPIHSLPHQRSRSLLGVTNVRGVLVACLSLSELLGLQAGRVTAGTQRVIPRMLILAGQTGSLVAPVDEVDGIHAVPLHVVQPAGRETAQAISQFSRGVMQWRGRHVTLLDDELLRQAMSRSLA